MRRKAGITAFLSACLSAFLLLSGGESSAGQDTPNAPYAIKPSAVAVPAGIAPGQYRRIIQPFENWILICDENLKAKRRICNVSQTIVDRNGIQLFSWSLTATENGKPFMILRTLPQTRIADRIALALPGRKQPVWVGFDGCTRTVCLGKTPVGPVLSAQIDKGATVTVSYHGPSGQTIEVKVPLKGLKEAVAAIR